MAHISAPYACSFKLVCPNIRIKGLFFIGWDTVFINSYQHCEILGSVAEE